MKSTGNSWTVLPRWAFWCATLLYAALLAWQAGSLPARMPAAFGLDGSVGEWSSRTHYVLIALAVGGIAVAGVVGMAATVARSNLRRDAALLRPAVARRDSALSGTVWSLGVVTMLFLCWMLHLVGQAARGNASVGSGFPVLVLLYAVFSTAWAVWVLRQLRLQRPAVEGTAS